MLVSNFITKNPSKGTSKDYAFLRETGIKHIERLARQIWTDYNVHDPGITLLELLCYAITDLGYRTDFDIKDLLTEQRNGEAFIDDTVFHTAKDIFPSHPVTFSDLRKILIDITGVKQAWISINKNVYYYLDVSDNKLIYNQDDPLDIQCLPLNGLYDVLIQKEDFVEEEDRLVMLQATTPTPTYLAPSGEGLNLKVRYPILTKSFALYLNIPNTGLNFEITIKLWKKDASGIYQEIDRYTKNELASQATFTYLFELEKELGKGDWRITAEGTNVEIGFETTSDYPYERIGIVELEAGWDSAAISTNYYYFYDFTFTYAVSPVDRESLLGAPARAINVGAVDNTVTGTGSYITANNQGLAFNVLCPITLESVAIYADDIYPIKIELYDRDDNLLESITTQVSTPNTLTRIELDWEISPALFYKIRASQVGTNTVKLYRNQSVGTDRVPFTFTGDKVVEVFAGSAGLNFNETYYFFYDWQIRYTPCLPTIAAPTLLDIQKAVKDKLYLHRNLCEDFMNIEVLKTEEIAVCMDLEVKPEADLEEVLAEIFYQLELYVSPPVNFYTIQELLDKGKTTDQIFEGPLLDHGFIDHEEFLRLDRRTCLRVSDIIQIIMDVEGVCAVKSISLLSFVEIDYAAIQPGDTIHQETDELGVIHYFRVTEEDWLLTLQDTSFYSPDFSPNRSKTYFYKNDLPYLANLSLVFDLLSEKRAQQIRTKLRGHQQGLPVPIGTFRDLSDYYPIQNELPETYFTGQNPVPANRPRLRKAQSNQLKGYLLFFEQIFANYLSQLANIKSLFSWDKDVPEQSYFTQKLREIADIEGLYLDDYDTQLDTKLVDIIESAALAAERKNKFLDHLIGRFCESLADYALMTRSILKEQAAARLITDKQAFLDDYPRLSSERSKGFDYRFPEEYDNITGFQRRVYRLLGIYDEDCQVGRQNFASDRIRCLDDSFRLLLDAANQDPNMYVFESNCCETKEQICTLIDTLITFGADEANWCELNWRVTPDWCTSDTNPFVNGYSWVLKRNCISCADLENLIATGDFEAAREEILGITNPAFISSSSDFEDLVLSHFQKYAQLEGFHVVENILLRKRTVEKSEDFLPVEIHSDKEECECVEVKDPYSFRASVILPSWPKRFKSTRFRQFIEHTLRLEAPAHVYLRICWISHCEMQEFENCHDAWLHAHAALDCKFRGERELPKLQVTPPEVDTLTPGEKSQLSTCSDVLGKLIDKLYDLNNIFSVARIHGCEDIDSEEPQLSLNNTSLGSL